MKIKNLRVFLENFAENAKYKLKGTKTGYPSIDRTHEKQYSFFVNNQIIPSANIYLLFKLMSLKNRDAYAIDCDNIRITYDELIHRADEVAKALKQLNVKKGDIITVSMPNYEQGVELFLAANKIGATVTFLNSYLEKEEVAKYLNEFESKLYVDFGKDDEYNKWIKEHTLVENVISLDETDVKGFPNTHRRSFARESIPYSRLGAIAKQYKKTINPYVSGKQEALILFTSGSTGNPKSVVLTNKNVIASGLYMKNSTNLGDTVGEKTLVCVPFCYPYGFATSTLMSLLCGREAIIAPIMSEDTICKYLEKRPNIIFGSPALLELLMRNVPEDMDLSFIHTFISGGDLLTGEQAERAIEFFKKHGADVKICNGAGNAETVGASTNAVGVPTRFETVGKVLAGQRAIVVNPDTLEEVKYGEVGTYYVSGDNVFKEYYRNPELTSKAKIKFKNREYVNTGMRGYLDEDGYFTLTGRDSRYYIMATLNKVYCDYVQRVISMIDEVDTCAVVKKPDKEMLFKGKAYIVLKDGVVPTKQLIEDIRNLCSNEFIDERTGETFQLKPYEIPVEFEFLSELPRHKESDKIDYTILEEDAKEEVNGKVKTLKRVNVM